MLKGFKDFLLRGNVLDLAVGIIVGAAFTAVVNGLMDGVLNPLISLIFGQPDISQVGFWIGDGPAPGADPTTATGTFFGVGLFLQAVLNFLIVATTLYFVVVVPVKHFTDRVKRGEEAPPEPEVPDADVVLLQEIRDLLAARNTQS